jgi:pyruvate formate lyase activating enzyme
MGLRFVYTGNVHRHREKLENTLCPSCGELCVEREGFTLVRNTMINGHCPSCAAAIPGVWA